MGKYVVVMEKDGKTGFSDGMTQEEAREMIEVYESNGYALVDMFEE